MIQDSEIYILYDLMRNWLYLEILNCRDKIQYNMRCYWVPSFTQIGFVISWKINKHPLSQTFEVIILVRFSERTMFNQILRIFFKDHWYIWNSFNLEVRLKKLIRHSDINSDCHVSCLVNKSDRATIIQ